MIIERYSLSTYTSDGGNHDKFKQIFDNLCEWDSVSSVSSQETNYIWGCATVKVKQNSSDISVTVTYGGTEFDVTGYRNWANFVFIKTKTSVGMMIYNGTKNASVPTDCGNSAVYKIVLTKNLNLNNRNDEKGIIYAIGTGTAGEFNLQAASEGIATTTATTIKTLTNAAVTILQPATCTTYTGYCPHVFVPIYQTCESSSSKATVNGANYYIMGGSLYLLDD